MSFLEDATYNFSLTFILIHSCISCSSFFICTNWVVYHYFSFDIERDGIALFVHEAAFKSWKTFHPSLLGSVKGHCEWRFGDAQRQELLRLTIHSCWRWVTWWIEWRRTKGASMGKKDMSRKEEERRYKSNQEVQWPWQELIVIKQIRLNRIRMRLCGN